ncbi:hypothetical protein [Parasphingorhabdus sp.]|uniref:hypothetical protein n=1 Tax=Parasphingorhabdus sp. TaxID=2709688 RepID=UPI002F95CA15
MAKKPKASKASADFIMANCYFDGVAPVLFKFGGDVGPIEISGTTVKNMRVIEGKKVEKLSLSNNSFYMEDPKESFEGGKGKKKPDEQ